MASRKVFHQKLQSESEGLIMKIKALLIAAILLASVCVISASQSDHASATPCLQISKSQDDLIKENVFVGSIKSDKYHYPSCSAAGRIKPENEIWFYSSADARAHGYVPCGICHPP